MPRNKIDANVRCPSCNGQLFPRVLVCDSCGLKVEGDFVLNEFGALTPDELHFLRVFIHCEGRIRDMEAALGVSYPTVKGHLASIKEKLNLARLRPKAPASTGIAAEPGEGVGPAAGSPAGSQAGGPAAAAGLTTEEVLDGLEQGRISYKDAVRLLRATPPSTSAPIPPSTSAPNPPSTSAPNPPSTSAQKKKERGDEQSGG
jgi:hypothetical protein